MKPALVIIGCGFVGRTLARHALAEGRPVHTTTRDPRRAVRLQAAGLSVSLLGDAAGFRELATRLRGADCVVTYPPDAAVDMRMAALCVEARATAYISSTAVYGDAAGRIDDETEAAPNSERGRRRLAAEALFCDAGAVVLRAPGIYGPERGVHIRLRAGAFHMIGDGEAFISRIHVDDLAGLALAACARGRPGATHVVGDLGPSSQRALLEFLCGHMGLPLPPSTARHAAHESLRGSRQVDPRKALRALSYTLRFADYRTGYADALAREHGAVDIG